MSEVDRLSNSGLYPALPIQDKQGGNGGATGKPPQDPRAKEPDPSAAEQSDSKTPRPPKSIIDEYA
jgi:hypothetical protein